MATLPPALAAFYLGDTRRDLRRRWHRLGRGRRRKVVFVHQVDDPYSLLLAQVLPPLLAAADAELEVLTIRGPKPEFAPDLERLRHWALRDAGGLAAQYGLDYPSEATLPDPEQVERAQAASLTIAGPAATRLAGLAALGVQLLSGAEIDGMPSHGVSHELERNAKRLAKLDHYQAGMLYYEGEWYWGLDRLELLGDRLRAEGLAIPPLLDPEARPRVVEGRLWGCALPSGPKAEDTPVELFYSLRSPYAYLSLARTRAIAKRHRVPLRIRVVMPMVKRGLAVPRSKRMYIATDAKRLADRLEIPFGRVHDPLGAIERGLAVAYYAANEGRLGSWLESFGAGVWAEGVNVGRDDNLKRLAKRADLDPERAIESLKRSKNWQAEAELNRQALLELGLWGVPSLRYGELTIWGQDRLDVLDVALESIARTSAPESA